MNSQRKGKRAELELAKLIKKLSGQKCRRTPMSGAIEELSRADLLGPVFSSSGVLAKQRWEAKNRSTVSFPAWWREACERGAGGIPVLAIRQVPGGAENWSVTLRLKDFVTICRRLWEYECEKNRKMWSDSRPSCVPFPVKA